MNVEDIYKPPKADPSPRRISHMGLFVFLAGLVGSQAMLYFAWTRESVVFGVAGFVVLLAVFGHLYRSFRNSRSR